MLQTFLLDLESWAPVSALRQSVWGYPLVSGTHVLSLALVFGSIAIVDLRLMGGMQRLDRATMISTIVPITLCAFVVAVLSGLALFAPAAREYLQNPYFVAKLFMIGLAGLNALALHAALRYQCSNDWMRIFGAGSLLLWCGVIFSGRMLAFG